MPCSLLPLLPADLSVSRIQHQPDRIVFLAASTATSAACPVCGQISARLHSHYSRILADLPCQGRVARIHVRARRFRCDTATCSRRIFAERLPGIAQVKSRRTMRLADSQRHIGLALGGEPGARLATRLAMPVSGDTLLRLIRAIALEPPPPPRVIGIDEWAWRRGLSYGTILCDLERGRVIDLLPDRNAETVAAWLQRHPSVAVIARDRAGVYADGIRQGAPDALQTADRWHLLRNLGDALRAAVDRHRGAVKAAAGLIAANLFPAHAEPAKPDETRLGVLRRARREHRRERYAEIRRLHEAGVPPRLIAPGLGVSKRTVERWLAAGGEPQHRRMPGRSSLAPFRAHLEQRWREGCHNAVDLCREISSRGFTGSLRTVRRWVASHRAARLPNAAMKHAQAAAAWPPPSRRRCAWLLSAEAGQISGTERTFIERLAEAAPALTAAADLAQRFTAMLRSGDAAGLDDWLAAAKHSELSGLANGMVRDLDAVRAGIVERWSTSPVEGQINRLKTIKRQMYGRAHHDLLRKRILAAA